MRSLLGPDKTAQMHRLIWAFAVPFSHSADNVLHWTIGIMVRTERGGAVGVGGDPVKWTVDFFLSLLLIHVCTLLQEHYCRKLFPFIV